MEYKFDSYRTTLLPNSDEIKEARKGRKTVAMVGMASTTRHLAPYDDETIPIWALNESATPRFDFLKRCDRIYQLHPEWDWSRFGNHNYDKYAEWLKENKVVEVVMQEVYSKVPKSVKYPIEEIVKKFGNEALYFTSSAPYLIAHALYEGYTRIEMYGFEMAADEEYSNQKPCAEFWLGVAIGQGCDIYLPPGNPLLGKEMALYGYEMVVGILPMHVELRKRAAFTQMEELKRKMAINEGTRVELVKKLSITPDDSAKQVIVKQITDLDNQTSMTVGQINFIQGAMAEIHNEESSLQGHLAKWNDVTSKNAAIMAAQRKEPAIVKPAIIPESAASWHTANPTEVIVHAPKKKKRRR